MAEANPVVILLVEDDLDHAELTMDTLSGHNINNQLIHVQNGVECIDYLNRTSPYDDDIRYPLPRLILLDVRMPKKDGFETLKEIRANPKFISLPVVMLTTSNNREEIQKGYEAGASSFITKPVEYEEFTEKIKSLQFYWLLVSELP